MSAPYVVNEQTQPTTNDQRRMTNDAPRVPHTPMPTPANLNAARARMLTEDLQSRGIRSVRVLRAMAHVPRERFVLPQYVGEAYSDKALPIECAQTISQPYMVALMSEALELAGDERVLEVGTGSGYQTAVLAELAAEVISIERHGGLTERAGGVLGGLDYENVRLMTGDGSGGVPEHAPYDRIIVTAAAERIPPVLVEQLSEGGLVVAPLGPSSGQVLEVVRKSGAVLQSRHLTACRFVPLIEGDSSPE